MGSALRLLEHNLHQVTLDSRQLLFHVPSSALFETGPLSHALIDTLRSRGEASLGELQQALAGRFAAQDVAEAVDELARMEMLGGDVVQAVNPLPVNRLPISTLVLNVTTGCNLSCNYCYKEDLDRPADARKMGLETAIASIEMLLRESPEEPRYTIVFFGGEPLSNLPLIREVVAYARPRFARAGKQVDFSLTTNATLLDEATIDWLDAQRFGIAVSIDGPQAVHDRNRISVGGQGSYQTVARKTRLLLQRYRSRPVGARVTLTHGSTEVLGIWRHLREELGFAEVGFAPVTAGDQARFNLEQGELAEIFTGFRTLADMYVDAALRNRFTGFSNLHHILGDIHEGTKKALPCGAGYSMLAIDAGGGVNLCHRFTGSTLPTFGEAQGNLDKDALRQFLGQRLDRTGTGCATCRIRNLCAGGCYHESYLRYGEAAHPVYHYCELMREWIDTALLAYGRILEGNPAFFATHLSQRRAPR